MMYVKPWKHYPSRKMRQKAQSVMRRANLSLSRVRVKWRPQPDSSPRQERFQRAESRRYQRGILLNRQPRVRLLRKGSAYLKRIKLRVVGLPLPVKSGALSLLISEKRYSEGRKLRQLGYVSSRSVTPL